MGFPSPATDYVENRLNPHGMCMTENSRILETSEGYAVIDPVIKLNPGEVLLILCDEHTQFAKLQGRVLITNDGEALERIAKADGSTCITDSARHLQVQPKFLFKRLSEWHWIYRRRWQGMAWLSRQDSIRSP